ncbi:MAG: hypothetical protein R6V41_12420 [Desulfobacteraceae bacterium]
MKVANQETIQEGEREFIDAVNAELDWDSIEKLLYEKFRLALRDEVEYRSGGLLVYDEKIACKLSFDVKVPLSIIFDIKGECLDISSPLPDEEEREDSPDEPDSKSFSSGSEKPDAFAEQASELAGVIDEINQGDEQ